MTVNVAEVEPAGIVMLPATEADKLDELRLTVAPPVKAGPFKVTVAVGLVPPTTEEGEMETVAA